MRLKIGSDDAIQAPPGGQGDIPLTAEEIAAGKNPVGAAPAAMKGTVSDADALKPVEHTKISTLQSLTPNSAMQGLSSPSGASVSLGNMLDAKLAVELLDAVLPAVLVVLMKYIGASMKKADLQLTEKEKKTFEPVIKACLDQLMINFSSPWTALAVTATVIYGAKLTEKGFVQMLDKKSAEKEFKKMEVAAEPERTGAPVITLKEAQSRVVDVNKPVPIDVTKVLWEPSNDLIKACVRRYKINRAASIIRLKQMYAKGQVESMEQLLNTK